MTNTEKPTTKTEKNKAGPIKKVKNKPIPTAKTPLPKKEDKKDVEEKKKEIKELVGEKIAKEDPSKNIKKEDKKVVKPIIKKEFAIINSRNIPISTKTSGAICRFIKNKTIENAITDLKQVMTLKKPVPMRGEIPHRKGRIMSGRFPKIAAEKFIAVLKSLKGNAMANGIEKPLIIEAISNIGNRPYGKFGSVRKKRTHITIKVKNIKK